MSYCSIDESEEFQALREIAKMQKGQNIHPEDSKIREMAQDAAKQRWEEAQKRLEEFMEELKKREEELFYQAFDDILDGKETDELAEMISQDVERQKLMEELSYLQFERKEVTGRDIEEILKEFERKGYIDIKGKNIKITSRGARVLARGFLRKILENLKKKSIGVHRAKEIGYGPNLSKSTRAYETGDSYERINIEKTFFNTLAAKRRINQLKIEDFEVHELIYHAKANVGIIIDESGSMNYLNKIDAAIETALSLSELIRTKYPEDKLRIFTFSEFVKEIPPWDVINVRTPMRCTNIRVAMESYRIATSQEEGDKQVYLITDSEPNFDDGKYIGFRKACLRVLEEALRYRQEEITLNIIMLGENYPAKEFARMVVQKNLGRVCFTRPQNLGEAIIEDYLTSKREKLQGN